MIYLIFILPIVVLWLVIKQQPKKIKESVFFNVFLLGTIFFVLAYLLNFSDFLKNNMFNSYIETVKNMIQIILLFVAVIVMIYAFIGFWGKRYSLRVDNFNIGGINILFDKSNEIFVKTVGGFIASKRTLFNFNKKRDNIDEVLNAYYDTYKFIKNNLELLDSEKDKDLYLASFTILQKLNRFLTKHQNDYRRWYDKVVANDVITTSQEKLIVHQTTIENVQECYYRYSELLSDIKEINKYFAESNVKKLFKIEHFDWSDE